MRCTSSPTTWTCALSRLTQTLRTPRRVVDLLECGWGCENGAVPDDEPDGRSFEDVARALAKLHQAVERLSTIDLDDVARAANEEASARAAGSRIWPDRWRRPATPPAVRKIRPCTTPARIRGPCPPRSKASRWRRWSPGAGGSSRGRSPCTTGRARASRSSCSERASRVRLGHGRRRAHADRPQGARALVGRGDPRRGASRGARRPWRVPLARQGAVRSVSRLRQHRPVSPWNGPLPVRSRR